MNSQHNNKKNKKKKCLALQRKFSGQVNAPNNVRGLFKEDLATVILSSTIADETLSQLENSHTNKHVLGRRKFLNVQGENRNFPINTVSYIEQCTNEEKMSKVDNKVNN